MPNVLVLISPVCKLLRFSGVSVNSKSNINENRNKFSATIAAKEVALNSSNTQGERMSHKDNIIQDLSCQTMNSCFMNGVRLVDVFLWTPCYYGRHWQHSRQEAEIILLDMEIFTIKDAITIYSFFMCQISRKLSSRDI